MSQENQPLLKLTGLRKSYQNRLILNVQELEIHRSQATLLVGPNGAGKSTLLRILAGLEKADLGMLYLDNQPLKRGVQRTLSGKVIYLHQHPYLFDCSVRDNIAYGLRQQRIPAAEREQRVNQALEWSGLDHLAERHAKTLSGGEEQRIALARAWVLKPSLLLLDEPTANMDLEAQEKTYFLVRRLVNEGMAVVMTSHSIRINHPMLSRVLRLENGRLKQAAQPEARTLCQSNATSYQNVP